MSDELLFGRMITAMVTPFDDDDKVDVVRAQELAQRLVAAGNDSLVVCGTTGESPTVTRAEKMDLFAAVKEAVGGKAKIIANVGGNCTESSVELAKDVESAIGPDGFLAVTPYYNKPPQEGLYQHYRALADAVDTPIVLYNIPGRCVVNMQADTTLRLATDCPNIVAIKEASGNMEQIAAIAKDAPDGFSVYSGDDEATLEIMGSGGVGVISTIGNIATGKMRQIVYLEAQGEHEQAVAAHALLVPLMRELFITANPIMVKEALNLSGVAVGGLRLPLVRATQQQSAELAAVMRECGVIE